MDKAFRDYNKAIELNPEYSNAYNNRGNVFDNKGELDKAFRDYNKAIELNPEYSNAYLGRGNVFYNKGELDKAFRDYNEAIELNPKDANAYLGRGNVFYNKGEMDKAIRDYNKAIELNPGLASPWLNLGLVYEKKEMAYESIKYYKRYIKLSKFNIGGNELHYLLEKFMSDHYFPGLVKKIYSTNNVNIGYGIINEKINDCIGKCEIIDLYILYLEVLGKSKNDSFQFNSLLALVNFYFGNPIESFRIYDETIDGELDCIDLKGQYYFLKSASTFMEPLNGILEYASSQAESYSSIDKDFQVEEMYYAGQILLLEEDLDKALICFQKASGFLPAEYMQLQVLLKQKKPHASDLKKKQIIENEYKKGESSPNESYLFGNHSGHITIDKEDYLHTFMKYFHYREIINPLSIVYDFVNNKETKHSSIRTTRVRKLFYIK